MTSVFGYLLIMAQYFINNELIICKFGIEMELENDRPLARVINEKRKTNTGVYALTEMDPVIGKGYRCLVRTAGNICQYGIWIGDIKRNLRAVAAHLPVKGKRDIHPSGTAIILEAIPLHGIKMTQWYR